MFPAKFTGLWPSLERLLLTLWVGGMLAVGYVVTPVLFSSLADRMLAGAVAGRLFGFVSLIGLVCGGLLLLGWVLRARRAAVGDWRLWVVCGMLLITLVGEFGLAPRMQELKQAAGAALVPGSDLHRQFSRLHGLSSILFLLNSLMGLGLVAAPPAARRRD
jgi:hypothetical protein